jgi:hypothetical protein
MASVARQFPGPVSAQQAAHVIDRVIRLFRDLGKPNERSVQGLWAELFVIATAADPLTVARSWRSATFDKADFATADQRLEVKSTGGSVRSHVFGAEQLRVPTGTVGVVASLFCQRSAGGVSVGELWSMARRLVAADSALQLALDGNVAATLGAGWKEAVLIRYDWHVARESLRYYMMADVPAVGVDPTPDVSDVTFRSSIGACRPLDARSMQKFGGLLAAAHTLADCTETAAATPQGRKLPELSGGQTR